MNVSLPPVSLYLCPKEGCDLLFLTLDETEHHYCVKHMNPPFRPFHCTICDCVFATVNGAQRHNQTTHAHNSQDQDQLVPFAVADGAALKEKQEQVRQALLTVQKREFQQFTKPPTGANARSGCKRPRTQKTETETIPPVTAAGRNGFGSAAPSTTPTKSQLNAPKMPLPMTIIEPEPSKAVSSKSVSLALSCVQSSVMDDDSAGGQSTDHAGGGGTQSSSSTAVPQSQSLAVPSKATDRKRHSEEPAKRPPKIGLSNRVAAGTTRAATDARQKEFTANHHKLRKLIGHNIEHFVLDLAKYRPLPMAERIDPASLCMARMPGYCYWPAQIKPHSAFCELSGHLQLQMRDKFELGEQQYRLVLFMDEKDFLYQMVATNKLQPFLPTVQQWKHYVNTQVQPRPSASEVKRVWTCASSSHSLRQKWVQAFDEANMRSKNRIVFFDPVHFGKDQDHPDESEGEEEEATEQC